MMRYRKLGILIAAMAFLGWSFGCGGGVEKRSKMQEDAIIGGALGTVIGAGAGHASALGGGPGALVGLSLGATTGALTSGWYYDDPDEMAVDAEELRRLQADLESRERDVSELEAQRLALMEAHREMQEELDELQRGVGEGAESAVHPAGAYKVTILADVMFDSGSADLTSEGRRVLARAARQIKEQFPDAEIEVRGHSDSVPITHSDWKSNWELSSARALDVLHYLTDEHGFSQERIRAVGFADTDPVASNATAEGRRKNRRAEIVIIPAGSQAAEEREFEVN